jgi:hypothetical protein
MLSNLFMKDSGVDFSEMGRPTNVHDIERRGRPSSVCSE